MPTSIRSTHATTPASAVPHRRPPLPLLAGLAALSATACATLPAAESPPPQPPAHAPTPAASANGLLVMAHGAGDEWNGAVAQAVAPLRRRVPLAVAFGMADPRTLQAALDTLSARGVSNVAVVRLFLSGASFLHQTQFLFGLRPDPPRWGLIGHRKTPGTELEPLATQARILLDPGGLAGSGAVAGILRDRTEAAAPERKAGVLLVAHGMGDDDENDRLLAAMERTAEELRAAGHAEVRTATLREDWAEARAAAEHEIRAAVTEMHGRHGRVVVLPYRLYGFGPYAGVLEGLAYESGPGLLPHPLITEWIAERATERFCSAGLSSPLASCAPADNRERANHTLQNKKTKRHVHAYSIPFRRGLARRDHPSPRLGRLRGHRGAAGRRLRGRRDHHRRLLAAGDRVP